MCSSQLCFSILIQSHRNDSLTFPFPLTTPLQQAKDFLPPIDDKDLYVVVNVREELKSLILRHWERTMIHAGRHVSLSFLEVLSFLSHF
jgi:hypothetical protein